MTTTTAQKLAQAQENEKAIAARKKAIENELAEIASQQAAISEEISKLAANQATIDNAIAALREVPAELLPEVLGAFNATTTPTPEPTPAPTPAPKAQSVEAARQALEKKANIPDYLLDCLKTALEPYCLGVEETLENAAILNDYDNPGISPGTLHYEDNEFIPSQSLTKWLETQKTTWAEMRVEIEATIQQKTSDNEAATATAITIPKPDETFASPYLALNSAISILIDEFHPLTGQAIINGDLPRAYEVSASDGQMILEIYTLESGKKLKSSWGTFPQKYKTAARLILKHYATTPELYTTFQGKYIEQIEARHREVEAQHREAKKDIGLDGIYPPGFSEENPVGEGQTPGFTMGAIGRTTKRTANQ